MSKKYYFNPAYKRYLQELKKLARAGGEISGKLALLAAVSSRMELSPEQRDVFERYFDGSARKLEKAIVEQDKRMRQAWVNFLAASDAAGIKRTHGVGSEDYDLYRRFYYLLRDVEANCDLRALVHEWANAHIKRIKDGKATVFPSYELRQSKDWKELRMLSVPVIMERYDKLIERRRRRGK